MERMIIAAWGERSPADSSPLPSPLQVDVDIRGRCAVISLYGELDVASGVRLGDIVAAAVDVGGLSEIEIDGNGLAFVDVAGLAALLRARDVALGCGVRYLLSRRSPALQRMLDLAGVGGRVADHALN